MRELKLKTKYEHFKGKEYITLCKSTPINLKEFGKSTININSIKAIHTEYEKSVNIYHFINNEYHHLDTECQDDLVIYTALYDTFETYARPYDMFMSEVDKVKYPNVKQKYRFEECEYEQVGKLHISTAKNHIEYLQNCFKSGSTVRIGEAKYLVKGFSYSNYPTLGIELDLVFKEFERMKEENNKNNKVKFKPGDKVKLNRPMPSDIEKQIEYRKFYNIVVTDVMEHKGEEFQMLGIEGIKGLISSEYFDLYEEENKRDFTIDELIFIQGNLGSLRENYREDLRYPFGSKWDRVLKRKIDTIDEIVCKITKLLDDVVTESRD